MSRTPTRGADPSDSPSERSARPAASSLSARLNQLLRDQTFADIARATNCNAETVRRYMRGAVPSVPFLIGVAYHYKVSLDWLLLGQEPRRRDGDDGRAIGEGPGQPSPRPPDLPAPQTAEGGHHRAEGAVAGRGRSGVVVRAAGMGETVQERS